MSTTTPAIARPAFSTAAFAQLVQRLRHTNARYHAIALQFRHRVRRTYHAQRHARRAGLRIDTAKARACPNKHISTHPPPVLDLSPDDLAWVDARATAETAFGRDAHGGARRGDACMRGMARDIAPERVVRQHRGPDGRPRITLRVPPLRLHLNVDCWTSVTAWEGSAPGAPRMNPRQLHEDACGTEEGMMRATSSWESRVDESLLAPVDVRVYSGLCITIPPRGSKRKLQDVEPDEDAECPRRPKVRWDGSLGR